MSKQIHTKWESKSCNETKYIQITATRLLVGSHSDSGQSDSAVSVTHEEFLEGKYQDLIRSNFGSTTLAEVIDSIHNVSEYPPFVKAIELNRSRRKFLGDLPQKPDLCLLLESTTAQRGCRNYGNAGGYKTVVQGGEGILTIESSHGSIHYPKDGTEYPLALNGHCSSAVGIHDHYYVVHSHDFAEISPRGEILFDTKDLTDSIFGPGFRLIRILEQDGTIAIHYAWESTFGLLEYQPGKGFIARGDVGSRKTEAEQPESQRQTPCATPTQVSTDAHQPANAWDAWVSKMRAFFSSHKND
jgi:hypothetical protein